LNFVVGAALLRSAERPVSAVPARGTSVLRQGRGGLSPVCRVTTFQRKPVLSLPFLLRLRFFGDLPRSLYWCSFCQYCWQKSEALKRFPVVLPTFVQSLKYC
jgi:hypothetical protein